MAAADRIKGIKDQEGKALLLDAGDAIWAGNVYVNPFSERILGWMNYLGYDAMALGNREFHAWRWVLKRKLKGAKFPVLCANLVGKGIPEVVKPYIVREVGGVKIGILGLTIVAISKDSIWRRLSHFHFLDPVEAAKKYISGLRRACDLVIALTHIGLAEDKRLAWADLDLDLIIGGHSHIPLAEPLRINDTFILQSGAYGKYLGQLDLEVVKGRLVGLEGKLISLACEKKWQWPT